MPFGSCNTCYFPVFYDVIFSDMVEETIYVFMDDFSIAGDSVDRCLDYLAKVFKICEDCNLVLN